MLGTPPQPTDVVKRLHQLTAMQEGKKLKQQHESKIQAPAQATRTRAALGSAQGLPQGSAQGLPSLCLSKDLWQGSQLQSLNYHRNAPFLRFGHLSPRNHHSVLISAVLLLKTIN